MPEDIGEPTVTSTDELLLLSLGSAAAMAANYNAVLLPTLSVQWVMVVVSGALPTCLGPVC
jgi:hypothetical protein